MSVNTEDLERLSMLLDGDLSPEEAQSLRARIAQEPDLADAWRAISALPLAIAALPSPALPPQLRARPGVRLPRRELLAWSLAAAMALLALWPSPPPPQLLEGELLLNGDTTLRLADAATLSLDGRALLRVEPQGQDARVTGAEVENMNLNTLGGGALGALLTVTVYEGRALLTPDEQAPITLAAGQTQKLGGSAESEPLPGTLKPGEPRPLVGANPTATPSGAQLQEELGRLRLENQMLRGQLQAVEGSPQPWPANTPAQMRPEGYKALLSSLLDESEALIALDCEEYPCVALVEMPPDSKHGEALVQEVQDALAPSAGEEMSAVVMAREQDDGEGPRGVLAFAIAPGDSFGREVAQRTRTRAELLLNEGDE